MPVGAGGMPTLKAAGGAKGVLDISKQKIAFPAFFDYIKTV